MPTPKTPDLVFQDPPESKRGRPVGTSPLGLWLTALRDHPGQWAVYPEPCLTSPVTAIKNGGYGTKKGEYEATGRAATNNRVTLFARYVGPVAP